MVTESKTTRRPSRKVLEAISGGLEEIEAQFDSSGFSSSTVKSVGEEPPAGPIIGGPEEAEEKEEEDDDGEEYYSDHYFDREEIEVGLDAFISHLINSEVIRKPKPGKTPSFSEVFEKFFGKDHEVTEKANGFEGFIKGYFGWVSPENMRLAHDAFLEIRGIVQSAMKEGERAAE